jgi:hypothetical protein
VLLLNYNFQSLETIWLFDHWASSNSFTRVLSHLQDNQEKVIAYMSKAFNKEEHIYCVTRKEPIFMEGILQILFVYVFIFLTPN